MENPFSSNPYITAVTKKIRSLKKKFVLNFFPEMFIEIELCFILFDKVGKNIEN